MEYVLRVDERGRIVIPRKVREELNIGKVVKMHIKDRRIIIEPVRDPLEELTDLVVKVHVKASTQPQKLSELAYIRLMKDIVGEKKDEECSCGD